MIEFALVLPIFLLLVFGILDLGRIVFLKAELENAVREGVRVGQVTVPFNTTPIANKVKAQPLLQNAAVTTTCSPTGCPYGSMVTVSATLPTTFAASRFLPGTGALTLRASASGRIE